MNNTIVGGSVFVNEAAAPLIVSGINFKLGQQSFADGVTSYNPLLAGGPAPVAGLQITTDILGTPNYTSNVEPVPGQGVLSLGHGGQVIIQFNDNFLRASGDSRPICMSRK